MKIVWRAVLIGSLAVCISRSGFAQRGSAGYVPQVNAGDRALAAHHYASAASAYRYALEWNPQGVAAHNGLGSVYLKQGKKDRALEEFTISLRYEPHSSEAERGIHEARSSGEEEAAFQALSLQASAEPNNAEVQTTFAEELIERGRLIEAKDRADAALRLDKKSWHAYCALGRIAFKQGDLRSAIEQLSVAISHDSTDDDAVAALGDIAMEQKRYRDAATQFRLLIRILPDEREGYQKLITALDAQDDKVGSNRVREALGHLELRLSEGGE